MAMLAEVLAFLQRETGERWSGGSQRRQAKGVPAKPIPTIRMCVHKLLSVKHFHAVSTRNAHECLLKSSFGKASLICKPLRFGIRMLCPQLQANVPIPEIRAHMGNTLRCSRITV